MFWSWGQESTPGNWDQFCVNQYHSCPNASCPHLISYCFSHGGYFPFERKLQYLQLTRSSPYKRISAQNTPYQIPSDLTSPLLWLIVRVAMDRPFNFMDHPHLIRHSLGGSNPQNPSTSLLPSSSPLHITQHAVSEHQAHQQTHQQPAQQLHPHSHQRFRQYQPISHREQQVSSEPFIRQESQHSYRYTSCQLQHRQHAPQQQSSHIRASPLHQIQQHLQLQPVEMQHQDSMTAVAGSSVAHSPAMNLQHRLQSRHHRPPSSQHSQTSQLQLHQLQPQPHSHGQHMPSQPQQTSNHHQRHLASFHMSHPPSQIASLTIPTNGSSSAFPYTTGLAQNSPPLVQSLAREGLQSHQNDPIQSQNGLSQPAMASASNANSSLPGSQSFHIHPGISTQQASQASFGSLTNLPSTVLQSEVMDDPAGTSHGSQQPGDALATTYTWDAAHPHNMIGTQTFGGSQNHSQPLVPLPLVSDARSNHNLNITGSNPTYGSANYGGPNAFVPLNNSMGMLRTSLNSTVMSSVVEGSAVGSSTGAPRSNANALGGNAGTVGGTVGNLGACVRGRRATGGNIGGNERVVACSLALSASGGTIRNNAANGTVAPTVAVSGTDLSPKLNCLSESCTRTGTTANKNRREDVLRKPSTTRTRMSRSVPQHGACTTSPVSDTVLPVGERWPVVANKPEVLSGRAMRPIRSGKANEHEPGIEVGVNRPPGVKSDVGSVDPASTTDGDTGLETNTAPDSSAFLVNRVRSTEILSVKKPSLSRTRSRRTSERLPNASVPVHLRNPKKGRARVFRECKQCKSENHIRRADCTQCKAPLPAGKRRRDGNPSFEKKISNFTSSVLNIRVHLPQPPPISPMGLNGTGMSPPAI